MTNGPGVVWADRTKPPQRKEAPIGKRTVARVIEYIDAHPGVNIPLAAMARIAGVSANHFVQLFTHATGMTPHRYVLRARIDRARVLLEDQALTIAEVSRRSGFRTQEHFGKVFRKMVGITPREFRSTRK